MQIKHFDWDGSNPRALAAEIRALQPPLGEVGEPVAGLVAEVRRGGDSALMEIERRFASGSVDPGSLRQPDEALKSAASRVGPEIARRPGDGRGQHPIGRGGSAGR